jgi:uncharacterized glyoxalase superfamily protein PhnB
MIFPTLRYRDAVKAIDWLVEAFGFEKSAVHLTEEGTVGHAELRYGKGLVMLNSASGELAAVPGDFKLTACSLYVPVSDVDAHHDRARAAGAEITMPLTDMDYGSREYSARDLEGNHWHFGSYMPEIW